MTITEVIDKSHRDLLLARKIIFSEEFNSVALPSAGGRVETGSTEIVRRVYVERWHKGDELLETVDEAVHRCHVNWHHTTRTPPKENRSESAPQALTFAVQTCLH